MNELSCLRGSERYGACDDEGCGSIRKYDYNRNGGKT